MGAAQLDGLHLRVDLAARPRGASNAGTGADAGSASRGAADPGAVLYDPARSIFVGNLPFDVQARPAPRRSAAARLPAPASVQMQAERALGPKLRAGRGGHPRVQPHGRRGRGRPGRRPRSSARRRRRGRDGRARGPRC